MCHGERGPCLVHQAADPGSSRQRMPSRVHPAASPWTIHGNGTSHVAMQSSTPLSLSSHVTRAHCIAKPPASLLHSTLRHGGAAAHRACAARRAGLRAPPPRRPAPSGPAGRARHVQGRGPHVGWACTRGPGLGQPGGYSCKHKTMLRLVPYVTRLGPHARPCSTALLSVAFCLAPRPTSAGSKHAAGREPASASSSTRG